MAWGLASDKIAILLAVVLVTMTVLSAGALHPIDTLINTYPRPFESERFRTFLILWPDTVASRAVALPVLTVVAGHLAYWHRSWRPVVLAVGGVFGMVCLVATMKVVLRRSHPRSGDPAFFADSGEWFPSESVSFPSGHGANAILIYGLVLFLIVRYRAVRPHIVPRFAYAIAAIAILQSLVSAYLHFHWFTDLVTGMVAGAFALRLTMKLDEMIPDGRTAAWWPFYGRAATLGVADRVMRLLRWSLDSRRRPGPRGLAGAPTCPTCHDTGKNCAGHGARRR
ncbi:phosphatase PAP2 family protein [Actinorugispora endophytica]|uniref:phosphatase PAP2 family protein n=1 Tax=Actinorugispora endophytica TaxID=1605990 RepID=UPI001FB8079F|nr:phosphatase PAP2 family protein [Actinorugispora endophytica]